MHSALKMMSAALLAGILAFPVSAQEKKAVPETKKEQEKKIDFKAFVDKKDAIYKKGEPIKFTVELKDAESYPGVKIYYVLFQNGNPVKRGTEPADKVITLESKLDQPGWVMLEASLIGEDKKPVKISAKRNAKAGIGAMVDPLEIKDAGCEPADFDQFWQQQRKALNEVPVKATRTRVEVPKKWEGKVDVFDVQVDCAGGKPVSGYLAMPANAKKGSLPALVSYHGAGVYSARKDIWRAYRGMISFNVNAHGIPNGKPAEYYKELAANELKGYPQFGKMSRETSYFKGMFLRVMRALDYVKTLPEWDGKTLIVTGGSQGGGQAIAAAALDPQVTLCVANVPAIGDHGGRLVGRYAGWPRLFNKVKLEEEDKKGIAESAYFDHNYLAKRIKCETYIGTGFIDRVCPPTSVYAAYNNLPTSVKKSIQTTPDKGHNAPLTIGNKRIADFYLKKK